MRDKGKKLTGFWPSIKMKAAISIWPYCPSLRWTISIFLSCASAFCFLTLLPVGSFPVCGVKACSGLPFAPRNGVAFVATSAPGPGRREGGPESF